MTLPHFSRVRDRSDGRWLNSVNTSVSYYGGPLIERLENKKHYYESFKQHMEDCINPYSSRGFRSPGPCYAYKIKRTGLVSGHWTDPNPEGLYTTYDQSVSEDHLDLSQIVSFCPTVPESMLLDNRLAALSKSITQIPTEVSIINFALELLDFKESFAHYQKAVTKGGLKMHEVPGWANSTLLDYNFNLSPFIGDIKKIIGVWQRVTDRLNFLKNNRGKPVRQSFFNPNLWDENPHVGQEIYRYTHSGPFGDPADNPVYDTYMGAYSGNYGYASIDVDSYKAMFSASWYLLQELDGLDDAWAQLRGLIAGLGINNPAKIVWNAIPFSFIADWMFPFGKTLDYLAVQPFQGRWEVYDVVNSIKETWRLKQNRVYANEVLGMGQTRTNTVVVERYHRWLGLNIALQDIDFTDFTQQQQLLLGSLLAGNTLFRDGKKAHKK